MIKNIIFDLGDIFVNLDKKIFFQRMERLVENPALFNEILELNKALEVGKIDREEFFQYFIRINPSTTKEEIIDSWNSILVGFPKNRLDFIERFALKNTYRLFLLSNTNVIHIERIEEMLGQNKYNTFENCFEKIYLSHELKLRKPSRKIYEFVLEENNLNSNSTLFIDDTVENTIAAEEMGINCWNLKVGIEDVIDLEFYLATHYKN